jgi:hypothetical protein
MLSDYSHLVPARIRHALQVVGTVSRLMMWFETKFRWRAALYYRTGGTWGPLERGSLRTHNGGLVVLPLFISVLLKHYTSLDVITKGLIISQSLPVKPLYNMLRWVSQHTIHRLFTVENITKSEVKVLHSSEKKTSAVLLEAYLSSIDKSLHVLLAVTSNGVTSTKSNFLFPFFSPWVVM